MLRIGQLALILFVVEGTDSIADDSGKLCRSREECSYPAASVLQTKQIPSSLSSSFGRSPTPSGCPVASPIAPPGKLCDTVTLGQKWSETCTNSNDICEGAVRTDGETCDDFCTSVGLTCTDGWAADDTCGSRGDRKGCGKGYVRQICQCKSSTPPTPSGPDPTPCPPNPTPSGPSPTPSGPNPTPSPNPPPSNVVFNKYGGYMNAEGWRLILSDEQGKGEFEKMGCPRDKHEERLYDKSQHESKYSDRVKKVGNGHVRWELMEDRGPSNTIWKSLPPKALKEEGDKLILKMKWKTEPKDTVAAQDRCPPEQRAAEGERRRRYWEEEIPEAGGNRRRSSDGGDRRRRRNPYLRCLAGTGDFRIGLFNSRGTSATDRGMDEMYKWPAYQVRFNPHVDREGRDHIGENDVSNGSFWWRIIFAHKAAIGLLDDWCQDGERCDSERKACGFEKLEHDGEKKFKLGSEAPFNEWYNVDIVLERKGGKVKSSLNIAGDIFGLDAFDDRVKIRTEEMNIDAVDVVAISYNNNRPYNGLEIKDVVLEGRSV